MIDWSLPTCPISRKLDGASSMSRDRIGYCGQGRGDHRDRAGLAQSLLALITDPRSHTSAVCSACTGCCSVLQPGFRPARVVGAICLLIALYALQLLPVNLPAWVASSASRS